MEKYVVSARKYRPIKFEDVVGQSHVTTTLENAIKNEKVAQSILFVDQEELVKLRVQEY